MLFSGRAFSYLRYHVDSNKYAQNNVSPEPYETKYSKIGIVKFSEDSHNGTEVICFV